MMKFSKFTKTLMALCCALTATEVSAGCMDTDNQMWINDAGAQAVYDKLMGQMACPLDADKQTLTQQIDQVACNYFAAKACRFFTT